MKKSEALALAGSAGRGSNRDLEKLLRGIVGGEVGGGDLPELAEVARSGEYDDLNGLPDLGSAASADTGAFVSSATGWGSYSEQYAGDNIHNVPIGNKRYSVWGTTTSNMPDGEWYYVDVHEFRSFSEGSHRKIIATGATGPNNGKTFVKFREDAEWGGWAELPAADSWTETGRALAAAEDAQAAKDILGISNLAPVPAPEGGADVDTEARAAIDLIIARLVEAGIFTADD